MFDISLNLGLSGEEHLSLAGLAKTRRSSKALLKDYEAAEEEHKDNLVALQQLELKRQKEAQQKTSSKSVNEDGAPDHHLKPIEPHEDDDSGPSPGQMTLF